MNNYEYIIASLPTISAETRELSPDADEVIAEIISQLSDSDIRTAEFFLDGFRSDALNEEFYRKALASRCGFVREYFRFDLGLRNTKTAWLNKALGREDGKDMIFLEEDEEFPLKAEAEALLSDSDILGRERGLDDFVWKKVDELTELHVFDLALVLGFIAKLKIVDRWIRLDEQTGRGLFSKFVEEIRKSKNI